MLFYLLKTSIAVLTISLVVRIIMTNYPSMRTAGAGSACGDTPAVIIIATVLIVTVLGSPVLLGGARVPVLGLVLSFLAKCGGDGYNYYSNQ